MTVKEREELEMLREENHQLRELLYSKTTDKFLGLSTQQSIIVKAIARRGPLSAAAIIEILEFDDIKRKWERSHIGAQVFDARAKLRAHGIEIHSRPHYGYWLDKKDVERLRREGFI